MPTFEQLGNLGPNFSIANGFKPAVQQAPSTFSVRYTFAGGGYQLFGNFVLNEDKTQIVSGVINQIDLLDSAGALAGRIAGINFMSYGQFISLRSNPAALVATIFAGNDIIVSPQRDQPTRLEGFGGDDVLRAARSFGGANDYLDGGTGNDELYGFGGNDSLYGGSGSDLLFGGTGDDQMFGGANSDDELWGQDGNDRLDGGTGSDQMFGGAGNDTYFLDHMLDVTFEYANEGTDTVVSTKTLTLGADLENLTLLNGAFHGTGNELNNVIIGNAANNTLTGLDGNDILMGQDGADTLLGGTGNDTLVGGNGTDILVGGAGRDVMTGGLGYRDFFRFTSLSDLGATAATRDVIKDFRGTETNSAGIKIQGDVLDLSLIDANPALPGDQSFRYVGSQFSLLSPRNGDLRYYTVNVPNTPSNTIIEGDMNGDRIADFQIELVAPIFLAQHLIL